MQPQAETAPLIELRQLADRPNAPRSWSEDELASFPELYRYACTYVARHARSSGRAASVAETRRVLGRAQNLLHEEPRSIRSVWHAGLETLLEDCPRAIRAEWRLVLTSAVAVYGLALVAWFAVSRNLDLAPSLLEPRVVQNEIEQLVELQPGERFVGNFDFGIGEAPQTAGWIMTNNMRVGALFFASALVPPVFLYVLATNGLMLGTYTAVAGHWGQAGSISSILWCHGVLEIQALLLAAAAGMCLVRSWIRPGARTRTQAMAAESRQALLLLIPSFPLLFLAGVIEAYVSPFAPLPVRLATAAGTGLLLVLYVALGSRREPRTA